MAYKRHTPYIFIAPALLLVLVFVYYPVIMNFYYSFHKLSTYSESIEFVGWANFTKLFAEPTLYTMCINVLKYMVISIICQVFGGTLFAIMLESRSLGKMSSFYRNMLFIPSLISMTAIGIMFRQIYRPDNGLINEIIRAVTGMTKADWSFPWLGDENVTIYAVIFISQWQSIGYIAMLMTVALQKIPEELYESAAIDGANAVQRAWHISLPQAREQFLLCIIITCIGSFQVMTEVYITTSGGPGTATMTPALFIYLQAFKHDAMGYAAAGAVMLFLITMLTSLVQLRVGRSGSENSY